MNRVAEATCFLRKARLENLNYILQAERETAAISFGREQTPEEMKYRNYRLHRALEIGDILIGEQAGKTLGYCWIEKSGGDESTLIDFYVEKVCRGRGVADWLFRSAASDCMRSGVKTLRLVISDRNTPSIRFFTRHGAICNDAVALDGLREYELRLESLK